MVKVILFDLDGIIIEREMYFSDRFSRDFGVPKEKVMKFFQNEFKLCATGRADLKEELKKYITDWNWKGSVGELLEYWFMNESNINNKAVEQIQKLRAQNIVCCVISDNEKYRAEYIKNNLGLEAKFDKMIFSCDLGYTKTQPEFWESIMKIFPGFEKSEMAVWDNDEKKVSTAKAHGLVAINYKNFETALGETIG